MKKDRFVSLDHNEVYQSYLPLAHVFERTMELVIFFLGGAVGFYQGDTTKLMDDLANLRPTVFASVPRLYNKIYDGVLSAVNKKGGIAKMLFDYAFKSKLYYLKNGQGSTHALWDRVVFNKIKDKLGGRVKLMITGSAPLSGEVVNFFRVVFCTTMIEGYGQVSSIPYRLAIIRPKPCFLSAGDNSS